MSDTHDRIYYIYIIVNNKNGKTYIGQRKCPSNKDIYSDKYMGSGKLVRKSQEKYGLESFRKEILAVCSSKLVVDILEKEYIKLYREIGKAEYNISSGGDGGDTFSGRKHSEETKRLMSEHNRCKNRVYTQEERYKLGYWRGKKHTEEYKLMMSEKLKGKNTYEKSKEHRDKISSGVKKLWEDENYRKNQVEKHKNKPAWNKGLVCSESTKEKLRKANLGKKLSEETREKIRLSSTGRKHSEETKHILSAKLKGRVFSKEWTEKLSKACKGTHYYNNGVVTVRARECPEGFVPGYIKKKK
ncbi:MAG: GIY-YIG nuclease family protein [Paludibacteraceae bacterium]|nr:GIY-YIG nuclease family protein [Paludibacteraceae bacterium]